MASTDDDEPPVTAATEAAELPLLRGDERPLPLLHCRNAAATSNSTSLSFFDTCTSPAPFFDPPPHALPLRVELPRGLLSRVFAGVDFVVLPDRLKRAAVRSVLYHVLYARGVLPSPVPELLRAASTAAGHRRDVEDDELDENDRGPNGVVSSTTATRRAPKRKRRSTTRTERKMAKCAAQLQALLSDIDDLFGVVKDGSDGGENDDDEGGSKNKSAHAVEAASSSGVRIIAVTIGPSLSSPKEQYVVRFCGGGSDGDADDADVVEAAPFRRTRRQRTAATTTMDRAIQIERELSRRVVREFLRGTSDPAYATIFGGGSAAAGGSCKISVAALIDRAACRRIFRCGDESSSSSTTTMTGNEIKFGAVSASAEKGMEDTSPPSGVDDAAADAPPSQSRFHRLSRRLVVRHNYAVKTPRRIGSRKRGRHRPYAVLDVATAAPAASRDETVERDDEGGGEGNAPKYGKGGGDATWMTFRSTVNGFRV